MCVWVVASSPGLQRRTSPLDHRRYLALGRINDFEPIGFPVRQVVEADPQLHRLFDAAFRRIKRVCFPALSNISEPIDQTLIASIVWAKAMTSSATRLTS
jgi:hypothetical protein